MAEFVTDRSNYHVCLLKSLRGRNYADLSSAEKNLWDTEAVKGAYNYTDLNRVENAVTEIAAAIGLGVVTKTNWTMADIPYWSEMYRYLGNIQAIISEYPVPDSISADIPTTMSGLTWKGANAIEKALEYIYININSVAITYDLTGVNLSNKPTYVMKNSSFSTTITPKDNYEIDTVYVTMGGSNISNRWNSQTGVLSIPIVTGTIHIVVSANSIISETSVLGTSVLGNMILGSN